MTLSTAQATPLTLEDIRTNQRAIYIEERTKDDPSATGAALAAREARHLFPSPQDQALSTRDVRPQAPTQQ